MKPSLSPWAVEPLDMNKRLYRAAIVSHRSKVALAEVFGRSFEEVQANAKLIAQAPDMQNILASLKEAWLAGRMDDVEGILTGDVLSELLED